MHALTMLLAAAATAAGTEPPADALLGRQLPVWTVVPFAGLLLAIALLPLVAGHWFEKNRHKALVAALFGIPVLVYLVAGFGGLGLHQIVSTGEEYFSFICLLAALYTIAGGIFITGNLLGTPGTNLGFLAVGAVLANLIGTTGAAMVLIRPLLRANSDRQYKQHIVIFFIFIVCNCGGLLTPLGDPPLFLGFLRGVDFFWTLRLFPEWLLTNAIVMAVFLAFEWRWFRKEAPSELTADLAHYELPGLQGKLNLVFLLGVLGAVLASAPLAALGAKIHFPFLRELLMLLMVVLSLKLGPREPRQNNKFTWAPIQEVAILFAGIFAAMIPALALLKARGAELGLDQPWQFFWATGVLSSFLDNAPTYLTFVSTAQGLLGIDQLSGLMSETATAAGQLPARFLAAISCGAVLMGANSYIGNAPNFMVKAIAEESGIKMPSFFGYMLYSGLILVPCFILTTLIFFR